MKYTERQNDKFRRGKEGLLGEEVDLYAETSLLSNGKHIDINLRPKGEFNLYRGRRGRRWCSHEKRASVSGSTSSNIIRTASCF